MQFEIDIKIPSLNEHINSLKNNKYVGNKFKQDIERDVMLQIHKQVIENDYKIPFKDMVDIEFTFVEETKKRDKDNISAFGRKVCLDAFVRYGVLNNDGWRWVGDFKENFMLGDDYKIIINLKPKGEKENE